MIMGLSHIAFGTDDIDGATERLAAFGYSTRFDEPELENHISKTPLLGRYQPRHHIRSLAAEGAMAIELLDHGRLVGPQSAALLPIFQSAMPLEDWQPVATSGLPISDSAYETFTKALGRQPLAFHDPVLKMTLLWTSSDKPPPGLLACAVLVDDPSPLCNLLSQLRFRSDPATGLWSLLTPLPALQARLIPVPAKRHLDWAETPILDAPGCPCIALMARATDRSDPPAALRGKGNSFTVEVNGKLNRITLARPDDGPIVEMVDPQT